MVMIETFDTVYQSVPEAPVTPVEALNVLGEFVKARPNTFFTAKELAQNTGFKAAGTCVELRRAVTELIHFRQMPMVSCHAGFAFVTKSSMVRKYIEELGYRMSGLQRRIDDLKSIEVEMLLFEERAQLKGEVVGMDVVKSTEL